MITIRPMVKADLAGVAEIENENFSPWSDELLSQELEICQGIRIVADANGVQILGWCACRMMWPEAELLKIAVKKTKRECGIGRSLLDHLVVELQKRKITNLFLEVRSNNHVAINFYERHGFLQVGLRPNYYTDPPDSAMILKRKF